MANKTNENSNELKKQNKFVAWWTHLSKGARIAICVLGSAAIATAVVVPTVIVATRKNTYKITYDKDYSAQIDGLTLKEDNYCYSTYFIAKEVDKIVKVLKVTKGGVRLIPGEEYTCSVITGYFDISKKGINDKPGDIIIYLDIIDNPWFMKPSGGGFVANPDNISTSFIYPFTLIAKNDSQEQTIPFFKFYANNNDTGMNLALKNVYFDESFTISNDWKYKNDSKEFTGTPISVPVNTKVIINVVFEETSTNLSVTMDCNGGQ